MEFNLFNVTRIKTDTSGIFFIIILIVCVIAFWTACIKEEKKDNEEKERLEDTPIDVYKYTYDITMINKEKYQLKAGCWVTYDFRKYVETNIIRNEVIGIKECMINTKNISEVNLVDSAKKTINPIVDEVYDYFTYDVYSDKDVEEREVK